MSDPWREIEELERDPETQDVMLRAAIAFAEQLEREQGTAAERILRRMDVPVKAKPWWRLG